MRRYLIACLPLFLATPAAGQEQDQQLWVKLGADVKISDNIKLRWETNQRLSEREDGFSESQYLAAVRVQIAEGVTMTGGVNRVVSIKNGKTSSTEWRPRQEISFPIAAASSTKLAGRMRFEQQFHSEGNDVGFRVRPEISVTTPLAKDLDLVIAHESYFALATTDFGERAGHERMRNSVSLALPLTDIIDAEIGYLNQYRFNRDEPDKMEHALTFAISFGF